MSETSNLLPGEQRRLASILSRLASPYEGERAAAGLLATSFMEKHGLAWSDLAVSRPAVPVSTPPVSSQSSQDRRHSAGRGWRGYCRRHPQPSVHVLSCFA